MYMFMYVIILSLCCLCEDFCLVRFGNGVNVISCNKLYNIIKDKEL